MHAPRRYSAPRAVSLGRGAAGVAAGGSGRLVCPRLRPDAQATALHPRPGGPYRAWLENILDPWEEVREPLDVAGYAARLAASDFPGETLRVLKEKEQAKFGEYRTRQLVLEAWERLGDGKLA